MVTRAAWVRAGRVATVVLGAACGGAEPAAGSAGAAAPPQALPIHATASIPVAPGYIVDSIIAPEEELRRFQEGLTAPVRLAGGAAARETLVRRFVERLAAKDTAALRAMTLSRAEFAYLIYPGSGYTRPPYRTPPGLVWLQLSHATEQGLRRLPREEVSPADYVGHACPEGGVRDGRARLWRRCSVRLTGAGGDTSTVRLFGVIVEVEGRFKFASLDTDF